MERGKYLHSRIQKTLAICSVVMDLGHVVVLCLLKNRQNMVAALFYSSSSNTGSPFSTSSPTFAVTCISDDGLLCLGYDGIKKHFNLHLSDCKQCLILFKCWLGIYIYSFANFVYFYRLLFVILLMFIIFGFLCIF